jgi:DNA-binding response OmpR family regulator
MTKKILVVDDESKIVNLVKSFLIQAGFSVVVAYDGTEALTVFKLESPDLILLDLMLPDLDGYDVAREIRKQSTVPIIMLTARSDAEDRVVGLELGADDYVPKPFHPKELVARVRAVLRRVEEQSVPKTIQVGELRLDLERVEAHWQGKLLTLTTMQFQLLATLAAHPGRVYSRESLLDSLTGTTYAMTARAIDPHIKNLRRKLGDDSHHPQIILTVPSMGYKFADTSSK